VAKIPKMRVPSHIKSNTVRIKKQANSTFSQGAGTEKWEFRSTIATENV